MNLLAIDTSTDIASVALKIGQEYLHKEQSHLKTHAQRLLPMIDELMADSGVGFNQLDAIVFGCGPGSFTGLRISCSMAKGLAFAHDLKLIPVSSLAAIAWGARKEHGGQWPVLALLDARMHEMYWGYFPPGVMLTEPIVSPAPAIVLPQETPLLVAGVGIDDYWSELPLSIQSHTKIRQLMHPNAKDMAELAIQAAIQPITAALAMPLYVRNHVTQGATRG